MIIPEVQAIRTRYAQALRAHFGADARRINHALKVLGFAERIMAGAGVAPELQKIIVITALLHDVGIKAAEEKYHSSAGSYQELEGPPIVRAIMASHGEPAPLVERVAYIVGGHHTPAKNDGLDFQIIWEADLLVNIEEDGLASDLAKLPAIIEKNFLTAAGRAIAQAEYLR